METSMDVSSVDRSSMWMPRSEIVSFTCGSFLFLACNGRVEESAFRVTQITQCMLDSKVLLTHKLKQSLKHDVSPSFTNSIPNSFVSLSKSISMAHCASATLHWGLTGHCTLKINLCLLSIYPPPITCFYSFGIGFVNRQTINYNSSGHQVIRKSSVLGGLGLSKDFGTRRIIIHCDTIYRQEGFVKCPLTGWQNYSCH